MTKFGSVKLQNKEQNMQIKSYWLASIPMKIAMLHSIPLSVSTTNSHQHIGITDWE